MENGNLAGVSLGEVNLCAIKLLNRDAHHAKINNMIMSFKHKGLKKYFETGSVAGIKPKHSRRLTMQLAAIDTALVIEDIDLPGFKLHALTGERKGTWSITVNGNWRITFEFADGNTYIINYEDYH